MAPDSTRGRGGHNLEDGRCGWWDGEEQRDLSYFGGGEGTTDRALGRLGLCRAGRQRAKDPTWPGVSIIKVSPI